MTTHTRVVRTVILVLALCMAGASAALAQEKGQVGATIAYPASAGVIWHPADWLGLRGTVSFSHSSTEIDVDPRVLADLALPALLPPPISLLAFPETSSTTWSFSFSGLFYLSHADGVSPYLSPRWSINRNSRSTGYSVTPYSFSPIDTSFDQVTVDHSFGGFFGVQYAPNRRFSMFAEVGIEHLNRDDDDALNLVESSVTAARAGVGVTLYFK